MTMIAREDLCFATCYQLGQMISADWPNPPAEVSAAIDALIPIDEPGEPSFGMPVMGANPLKLTTSESEPSSMRIFRTMMELEYVVRVLKVIVHHSDPWITEDSENFKKELNSRIADYETAIKKFSTPLPFNCNIVL